MSITLVQDAIIARAKQVLGAAIHYEALPATADLDAQLAARAKRFPAVFVAFLGGPAIGGDTVLLDAEFAMLVVTMGASEATRREGKQGAVTILERLVPALHGHIVADIGSLSLASVTNLFAPALDEKGLSLYAASYRIKLPMELDADPANNLAPLTTIHADWQLARPVDPAAPLPLPAGAADAVDVVSFPQTGEP